MGCPSKIDQSNLPTLQRRILLHHRIQPPLLSPGRRVLAKKMRPANNALLAFLIIEHADIGLEHHRNTRGRVRVWEEVRGGAVLGGGDEGLAETGG